jgi:hypothetical protein
MLGAMALHPVAQANAQNCMMQSINWCSSTAGFTTQVSPAASGTSATFNARTTIQTQDGPVTLNGRLTVECSNGQWVKQDETCTPLGTSTQFNPGGSVSSISGAASTTTAIESNDPCTTDAASNIFASRIGAAQKQSGLMNRELNKTVANPSIAEEAIKNARTCNDMVRDSLSAIFAGTPIGGLLSLFGLDKGSCDELYGFSGDVGSEHAPFIPDSEVNEPVTSTPPATGGGSTVYQWSRVNPCIDDVATQCALSNYTSYREDVYCFELRQVPLGTMYITQADIASESMCTGTKPQGQLRTCQSQEWIENRVSTITEQERALSSCRF